MEDGRVQILAYTKYKEMIRLSGKAYAVAEEEQVKWRDIIFEEQPYLANVYPGVTRSIGIIFCIDEGEVEYFNLGVNPIFRETYTLGNAKMKEKGYYITDSCIGCGECVKNCPQSCIEEGMPFEIQQNHCPTGVFMFPNQRAAELAVQTVKQYENKEKKVLFLELGVGYNTPGIIKYPFWQYTHNWKDAFYICINKGQAEAPSEIMNKAICLDVDISEAVKDIKRSVNL